MLGYATVSDLCTTRLHYKIIFKIYLLVVLNIFSPNRYLVWIHTMFTSSVMNEIAVTLTPGSEQWR